MTMIVPQEELHSMWEGVSIPIEHWHFHSQLHRRYGIVLAPGEFAHMMKSIETGAAPLIETRGGDKGVYSFRATSVRERFYVLAKGRHIITVLPPSKRLNGLRRALKAADTRLSESPVCAGPVFPL